MTWLYFDGASSESRLTDRPIQEIHEYRNPMRLPFSFISSSVSTLQLYTGAYHRVTTMRIPSVSWLFSVLCCFWIFLSFNISMASGQCLEDQKSLLLQLKNSLSFNESRSTKLVTWNQSLTCCDWIGVSCDEKGHVAGLDLSGESISGGFNSSSSIFSFQYLQMLNLASCNLKTFPAFLRYQFGLVNLDLSDNQIQGTIPNWTWTFENLTYLNLSHNLLTDMEPPLQNLTSKLILLDLHSNQLRGPIPVFPKYATYLDYSSNNLSSVIPYDIGDYLSVTVFLFLSNNSLHGGIPDSFCKASNLKVLDLSHNIFTGTIPPCLMTMSKALGVLTLQENNLTGHIPDNFPDWCALRTLDLRGNQIDGLMPKSLVNCTMLQVLDLGENQIMDGFPCMLTNISTLRVLVLRQNKFHGPIGCPNTSAMQVLQIIDLAFNNFSARIPPSFFETMKAMMTYENYEASHELDHFQFEGQFDQVYYRDRVAVTIKGLQLMLVKILTVFTSIDLSCNKFEGPIPKELGQLRALYILNLSHNAFSGHIPSSVGTLEQLESLDLSNNSLSGEIPAQITNLSVLSFLNLSYNHLVGRIPTGAQMQTFDQSSFIGNEGLCGPPLTQNCSSDSHLYN